MLATAVAFFWDDAEETVVEIVCLVALALLAVRLGGGRWFVVLVAPLPAFVLLHERIPVDHWVAYGPAALSLAIAAWADGAWRTSSTTTAG
ncbi:MAG TPA: hypothetical protein VF517_04115 [Thermoleophilaceae bacterium]